MIYSGLDKIWNQTPRVNWGAKVGEAKNQQQQESAQGTEREEKKRRRSCMEQP